MLRKLDKLWFRALDALHLWVLQRATAHCARERERRLRRHLAWQKQHLN